MNRRSIFLPTLLGFVLLLGAGPCFAGFEGSGLSPRAIAMGSAFTAVFDDPASVVYNPANIGQLRNFDYSMNYLRQNRIPAGEVDQDQMSMVLTFPVNQEMINGTIAGYWIYTDQEMLSIDRTTAFSYGTRGFKELDFGTLELGATLKFLNRSLERGGGATKMSWDGGILYRHKEKYAAGISWINIFGPRLDAAGNLRARAPTMLRLGFVEYVRDFTLAFDITKREPSGEHGVSTSFGAGMERWWATPRLGSFAARVGLNLGNQVKTASWGFGWRMMGGQFDYAMVLPVSGSPNPSHGFSLLFRFGQSDPEREYERLLEKEIEYRRDLSDALETGEIKQWKLGEDVKRLEGEVKGLKGRLDEKTLSEREARRKLKKAEGRRRRAVEKQRRLREKARRAAAMTPQKRFQEDWAAYQKLKRSGAPNPVLSEQLRRILRHYQDSGADVSEANREIRRLLRGG